MIFNILTVFRELIKPSLKYGVLSKAIKKNKIKVNIFSYSDYLNDGDRLDDKQFGGEPGMVIKYQNASRAINAIKKSNLFFYTFSNNFFYCCKTSFMTEIS